MEQKIIEFVSIVGVICFIAGLVSLIIIKARYYRFLRIKWEKEMELKNRELQFLEIDISRKIRADRTKN